MGFSLLVPPCSNLTEVMSEKFSSGAKVSTAWQPSKLCPGPTNALARHLRSALGSVCEDLRSISPTMASWLQNWSLKSFRETPSNPSKNISLGMLQKNRTQWLQVRATRIFSLRSEAELQMRLVWNRQKLWEIRHVFPVIPSFSRLSCLSLTELTEDFYMESVDVWDMEIRLDITRHYYLPVHDRNVAAALTHAVAALEISPGFLAPGEVGFFPPSSAGRWDFYRENHLRSEHQTISETPFHNFQVIQWSIFNDFHIFSW